MVQYAIKINTIFIKKKLNNSFLKFWSSKVIKIMLDQKTQDGLSNINYNSIMY